MRDARRRLIPALLVALACPSIGFAQAFAYVPVSESDTCPDPLQTGCTQGVILVLNATSNSIQSAFVIWRGGTSSQKILDVASTPAGDRVYLVVKTGVAAASLLALDTATGTTRQVSSGSVGAGADSPFHGRSLRISADGSRIVWQTGWEIEVLDGPSEQAIATIPIPATTLVFEMAITADGRTLYVDEYPDAVRAYDTATAQLIATLSMPLSTLALSPDETTLFATTANSLFIIDTRLNVVRTIPAATLPCGSEMRGVAFAHGRAWILCGSPIGNGYAMILDLDTFLVVGRVSNVPDASDATATADESRLLVRTYASYEMVTIDTATNTAQLAGIPYPIRNFGRIAPAPTTRVSSIVIDSPAGASPAAQPFDLTGWALDAHGFLGPGVDAVHVWAFPKDGGPPVFIGADYGRARPDREALFGSHYLHSGFLVTVRGLTPGDYQLGAFGHSTLAGTFSLATAVPVSVSASPQLIVDSPRDDEVVPFPLFVSGWTLDLAAASSTGIDAVHVWAYPASGGPPVFVGAATLGLDRPDVAAAFGKQFALSGFQLTSSSVQPGHYTLVVAAHDGLTGTFGIQQQVRVTIAQEF